MKMLFVSKGCGPVILRYAILMTAALALTFFIILHNDFRLELTEMRLKFNKSTKANLSEEEVGFLCPEEKVYKEAKENVIISALPHLDMWIIGLMLAFISDYMTTQDILNVTKNWKIFAILSKIRSLPFEKSIAIALIKMMMFLKEMAYSSLRVNFVDLNPNYAAFLKEFRSDLAALGGLLIPSIVNHFVKKNSASVYYWRKTFLYSAAILLCFTLIYAFFAME